MQMFALLDFNLVTYNIRDFDLVLIKTSLQLETRNPIADESRATGTLR